MSNSGEVLRSMGTREDIFDEYRERYGRHASREIARRYGVSQRTVQRAMRGETRHPKFAESEKFKADRAARAVRRIHVAHAGHVAVSYSGRDEGTRDIGDVQFGPGDLDDVIEALDRGDFDDAGDALDAAILDVYGGLGNALTIDEYEDGLSFD